MDNNNSSHRPLTIERLENRLALDASGLDQFIFDARDVNQDSHITPVDVLLVVNTLNAKAHGRILHSTAAESTGAQTDQPTTDVNRDGFTTPVDALIVINALNAKANGGALDSNAVDVALEEVVEEGVIVGDEVLEDISQPTGNVEGTQAAIDKVMGSDEETTAEAVEGDAIQENAAEEVAPILVTEEPFVGWVGGDYKPGAVNAIIHRIDRVEAHIHDTEGNDSVRILVDTRGLIVEALGEDGAILQSYVLPKDVMVIRTMMRAGNDTVDGSLSPVPLEVMSTGLKGEGNKHIIGSPFDDVILLGDGDDTVFAGAGNDRIKGGRGNNVIYGEDGDDYIEGNGSASSRDPGNNILYGGNGNDIIHGGPGNDYIDGGPGNDILVGGHFYSWKGVDGDDVIIGGSGDDLLNGRGGKNTLDGGEENDVIIGGGIDTVVADANDTTKFGELNVSNAYFAVTMEPIPTSGTIYVTGTDGNDNLRVVRPTPDGPVVVQALGDDGEILATEEFPAWVNKVFMYGGDGDDVLAIDANAQVSGFLQGGSGNDTLIGGGKNNDLFGGDGDDMLIGGGGKNHLIGDSGSDTLIGGSGDNYFDGDNSVIYAHGIVSTDTIVGGDGWNFVVKRKDKGDVDNITNVEFSGRNFRR